MRFIDIEVAQEVLSDHYDVYLQKENNPCSRTVEGHYELDAFLCAVGITETGDREFLDFRSEGREALLVRISWL